MKTIVEKDLPFIKRFWTYLSERFALLPHVLMISAFTFSAASYSRISRGSEDIIPWAFLVTGIITSFCFFLLLRIFDEFKDFDKDSIYQSYRPVPRGLISLKELKWVAIVIITLQIILNAIIMPVMLIAYALVMIYMAVMTKEFFLKDWILKHPVIYMITHMLIMPLIDFYTTGLDWINADSSPSKGLIFFLLVTFLNGIVIEIGRKIRAPECEETGVETYSFLWGYKKATVIWLIVITATFIAALFASHFAGFGLVGVFVLLAFLLICTLPALVFLFKKTQISAQYIEYAAGLWTIAMYLTLGGVPMLVKLLL
jgi:4-hydroxybenzoate polyprenyltransferase